MSALRKTALVGGVLYLITFATSIPARILFAPVRNDPDYILGPGLDTQVLFAGLLDVLLAFACIGPRSRCTRWSSDRITASRSGLSAPGRWRPPSS